MDQIRDVVRDLLLMSLIWLMFTLRWLVVTTLLWHNICQKIFEAFMLLFTMESELVIVERLRDQNPFAVASVLILSLLCCMDTVLVNVLQVRFLAHSLLLEHHWLCFLAFSPKYFCIYRKRNFMFQFDVLIEITFIIIRQVCVLICFDMHRDAILFDNAVTK